MSNVIFSLEESKWPFFDVSYAEDLRREYPEIWSMSSGTKSDNAYSVLMEIVDNDGIAITPEQVDVLQLRESWINRHVSDGSIPGHIAQVKWLAVSSNGEAWQKKRINEEVSKFHARSEWMLEKGAPCWKGYEQVGMKMGKKGKLVPNCVPIETKSAELKDPKGGLTAAGRKFFKRTEGADLKPGVMGAANTPEKLRRKGSFLTRFFSNPSGPMKDEKGKPTRLALSAAAWGEPVPQDASDAAALAAKGRRMLERYGNKKDTEKKEYQIPRYQVKAVQSKACPPATQDIAVNIKNRQKAIDTAGYGPLNPNEPNEAFWKKKGDRWDVSVGEAKKQKCGNCILFVRSPRILDCIEGGLGNESGAAWDVIDAGKIGYCEAFDFKCHSERTCDAWVVGGPTITDNDSRKPKEAPEEDD